MTDSDINTAYPDKDTLQDEILQYAYLVRAELETYTKWMDTSNKFLKYNAKYLNDIENVLCPNNNYYYTKCKKN